MDQGLYQACVMACLARVVVTPLLCLRYPPLGMRLDSGPGSALADTRWPGQCGY